MRLGQTAALRQCIHQYRDTLPALAPHSDAIQYVLEHDNLPALIAIYDAVYQDMADQAAVRTHMAQ